MLSEYKTWKVLCLHFTDRATNKRCHTIFTVTGRVGQHVKCPACRRTLTIDVRNSMELPKAETSPPVKVGASQTGTSYRRKRTKWGKKRFITRPDDNRTLG